MSRRAILFLVAFLLYGCSTQDIELSPEHKEDIDIKMNYTFPAEDTLHEGTWLIWPHAYTYGDEYRTKIEAIWIAMVKALHQGEKVHIIAYNQTEQQRIIKILQEASVNMEQIDFVIAPSDDVWVRDSGPMFVYDEKGEVTITDFAFDGWGKKTPYQNDDAIPSAVANAKKYPIISIPDIVIEGGAIELDGDGTFMACKSSMVSDNRNKDMTVEEVEAYARKYLGVKNFIWLDGVLDEDITDAHIDGIARFYDNKTLLTVSEQDFFDLYEGISEQDYDTLHAAKNSEGEPYRIVEMPMTDKNVKGLDYKGSYLNYYVANDVVLLPIYQDVNDDKAIAILSELFADKKIIPIDVTSLYQYGGMLHCITQQQPIPNKR